MNPTLVQAIWTLVASAVFVGIVAWAWSRRAGEEFAEAEQSPFADEARNARAERQAEVGRTAGTGWSSDREEGALR